MPQAAGAASRNIAMSAMSAMSSATANELLKDGKPEEALATLREALEKQDAAPRARSTLLANAGLCLGAPPGAGSLGNSMAGRRSSRRWRSRA